MSDARPGPGPRPSPLPTEADEGDTAEQSRDLLDDPAETDPEAFADRSRTLRLVPEADEADVAEQTAEVSDEDGFDHD